MTNLRKISTARSAYVARKRINLSANIAPAQVPESAFTLVEVMVGIAVTAVMGVALYAGIGVAFSQLRLSRENLRATQILEGKMEIVRQFNWDQVANYSGFIPSSFTEPFYANNPTNASGNLVYSGQVTVTSAPISESYSNDLKMVTIKLSWISRGVTHKRQASTFVSQYGLQRYVY